MDHKSLSTVVYLLHIVCVCLHRCKPRSQARGEGPENEASIHVVCSVHHEVSMMRSH